MPLYLNDLDIVSEVAGLSSALIVPCNMCPAVTVAVREEKPFIEFFRSFLKSVPFEQYVRALQSRLREKGVSTKVFKNYIPHQWFMCMWTSDRRKKLQKSAKQYDWKPSKQLFDVYRNVLIEQTQSLVMIRFLIDMTILTFLVFAI